MLLAISAGSGRAPTSRHDSGSLRLCRRPLCAVGNSDGPSSSGRDGSGARSAGPERQELRRADDDRPLVDELIIVEGPQDAKVVQKAVRASVFATNGTLPANPAKGYQMAPAVISRMKETAGGHPGVIVLSDPDLGGRLMRRRVEELLAPRACRHAFVSADDAVCLHTSGYKEEGDLGVEFASPALVRAAILAARDSTAARAEFTKDDLLRWRLAGEHGKPPPQPDEVPVPGSGGGERYLRGVGERRDLVGLALGFGACGDGAQFLKQLNRYGFDRDEVEAVVLGLDRDLVAAPLEEEDDDDEEGEEEEQTKEESDSAGGGDGRRIAEPQQ